MDWESTLIETMAELHGNRALGREWGSESFENRIKRYGLYRIMTVPVWGTIRFPPWTAGSDNATFHNALLSTVPVAILWPWHQTSVVHFPHEIDLVAIGWRNTGCLCY